MFRGIIQELGTVLSIREELDGKTLTFQCKDIPLSIGTSISINGACQSVTDCGESNTVKQRKEFSVYSSNETLHRTNLSFLKPSEFVNLETALTLATPIDGHLVQGHVDSRVQINEFSRKYSKGSARLQVHCPDSLMPFIIEKGGVALDGVSLTINGIDYKNKTFWITLIPQTLEKTVFSYRKTGDWLNLEVDFFAKYIKNFMDQKFPAK